MSDDRFYCAKCLRELTQSEESECDCGQGIWLLSHMIDHAEMTRRKVVAEMEMRAAQKDGLFK